MIKLQSESMDSMYIHFAFLVGVVFKLLYIGNLCEEPVTLSVLVRFSLPHFQMVSKMIGTPARPRLRNCSQHFRLFEDWWLPLLELDCYSLVLFFACPPFHKIHRPYWVMFSFAAFISLAISVIVFHAGYKFVKGTSDTIEFLFSLWLFYTIVGLTFGSLAFVINELRYFDDDSVGHSQALIIPLFYLPIFCILTFFLYRKLTNMFGF